jgi:hypothetical protein
MACCSARYGWRREVGFLSIAAAGVSAIGSIMQGQAQANAANYQAQVAANNAIIENQNAAYATEAGEAQAENVGLQNRQNLGRVKATEAALGVDVNTGSAVQAQQSARQMGVLNVQNTIQKANLAAYGYRAQATGFQAQSGLYGYEAETAPIGADLSAAGGFLGSAKDFPSWMNPFGGGGGGAVGATPDLSLYAAG